jgi:hypothetical protein
MLRKILVAVLFSFGCYLLTLAAMPQQGRTLVAGELWNAFGGQAIADRCCGFVSQCDGDVTHCDAMNGDPGGCASQNEAVNFFTNNKMCNTFIAPSPCTQDTNMDTCRSMTQCLYDFSLGQCRIGSAAIYTATCAHTCTPNC